MWRDGADFGRGETRTPPRGLLLPSVGRLSMTYATHTDSIIIFFLDHIPARQNVFVFAGRCS
jgi:hypothetical protein